MQLLALDFKSVLLIVAGLAVLGIANRLVWFLAKMSDSGIGFLTSIGLKGIAKTLLTILVDYDRRTYGKSRYMLRNQVPFRFAILWAGVLITIAVLFILKVGRSIQSVGQPFLFVVLVYLAYQCLRYWTSPRTNRSGLISSNQEVKERQAQSYSIMRRWDYLDELFAQ